MRRALRLLCLAVALVVPVPGSGTLSAQLPNGPAIPAARLRLGPPGNIDALADAPNVIDVGSRRGARYAVEASSF